ncbi:chemotaxis protein CheW [Kamptonema formosum]|uniref:chemotaxis protein CheW n=1 Tax=Kamptonema formosum TaxID=331992 RepID=UPI00034D84C9|nr:chemotaxis protein CheW [Oscillatoria sp. PCC 10802]
MLLCYVGEDRYAIESSRVVEVLPLVALRTLHQAPECVAGIFNYRGQIVSVIDLCRLMQGHQSRPHLSTRIVMVKYQDRDSTPRLLGVMAERVTETLNTPETKLVEPAVTVNSAPYLGKMIVGERGMIQCLRVEYLLPEPQRAEELPKHEG